MLFFCFLRILFKENVRLVDLSNYFCIIKMFQRFFNMLNSFLHLEMDFKQKKLMI
jgi:hypothetical protein